ncbi:hypothetical protein NH341_15270 [Tenacibaculum sp. XPcli2-G]|uniref:hypothetical protein n=1 Tax=Tenacibaculum sp. XPcli2-G TaxID=2954503 RepID=UPI002097CD0A|nr:hypothetical protein [Tenacibaculum sp. XPcli2-G]MCO7186782.1 hypothetical protein [Tenacibaculum sp. XPcli2-G]
MKTKTLIVLILFVLISCVKTTNYYYCDNIECSKGKYTIKLNSIDFFKYIKDSINYRVEYGSNKQTLSDKGLFIIDSIMKTHKYISEKERNLLLSMNTNTEYVQGKWGEEFCINYNFSFKDPKELRDFKIAFAKLNIAWNIPIIEAFSENKNELLGRLDTLKNADLMKKILTNNNRYLMKKRNKVFFVKSKKADLNFSLYNTTYMVFPKKIKEVHGNSYKLSEDRKQIIISDTIRNSPKKQKLPYIISLEF